MENNQEPAAQKPGDKDLWTVASSKLNEQQVTGSASTSKTFIFVGEKRCGKTSLIQKFFDETPKDDVPPTTALEFQYSTKQKDDKKVTVNAYELGGGRTLSSMISACMSADTLQDTTVCVCVDLSKAGNSIESALYWLNAVREQTEQIAQNMQASQKGQQRFALLKQRIQDKWADHEDRSKVKPQLVPVVLICSKYDAFANQYESARKKTICLALRYLAHANGASLVFASVREKVPSQLYKALLMSSVVEGAAAGRVETNQNAALNVPAGNDQFSKIGEPEGAQSRARVAMEQLWQESVEAQFEKVPDQQNVNLGKFMQQMQKYADERVDNMRRQKDEELEQYKRDIERQKRFEGKQAQYGGATPAHGDQPGSMQQKPVKMQIKRAAPGQQQAAPARRGQF